MPRHGGTKARPSMPSSRSSRKSSSSSQIKHLPSAAKDTKKLSWNVKSIFMSSTIVAAAAVLYLYTVKSGILGSRKDLEQTAIERAFDVVDLPGKGKGLVATRDIEQGELLIKERPLMLVPSSTNQSPVQLLNNRLNELTPRQRDEFYSLSFVTPGRDPDSLSQDDVTLAIFQTNAISAGDNVGLFPNTARLNHGCSAAFNSVYSWRPQEGDLVVHAIRPIKRGRELLTTYTDTKRPRHERQAYLQSNYDFTCSCSVCSLPEPESSASDKRLTIMSSLYRSFATWGPGEIDGPTASRIAKEIWRLGEEEGYWSERGRLASDVAHVAAAHSDEAVVLAWAKLAHLWYSIELGNDSTQALEMQALLKNPRSHFVWGTRQPQSLESPDP